MQENDKVESGLTMTKDDKEPYTVLADIVVLKAAGRQWMS